MRNSTKAIFEKAANSFQYRRGVKELENLFAENPHLATADGLCKLGMLYDHLAMSEKSAQRKKHESKALSLYRCALKQEPDSPRATWGIARVWWHRKSKKALPYARKAYRLAKKKKIPAALYAQHIGLIYETLGNYKIAEQWLKRGLREKMSDFGPYLNLIVFYNLTGNAKNARKYASLAHTLYEKELDIFKRTLWGKKVLEIILSAKKLPVK